MSWFHDEDATQPVDADVPSFSGPALDAPLYTGQKVLAQRSGCVQFEAATINRVSVSNGRQEYEVKFDKDKSIRKRITRSEINELVGVSRQKRRSVQLLIRDLLN